ncbi:MAG: hypothetical protein KGH61_05600 [Candidatus Micrarchaeota archaeon]|nr:hypothetical protein [Candidatus Micrarchaeota archaeon]MDE1864449.1 hypothetical protein [Candidatus Micrarchaeota archaeon]
MAELRGEKRIVKDILKKNARDIDLLKMDPVSLAREISQVASSSKGFVSEMESLSREYTMASVIKSTIIRSMAYGYCFSYEIKSESVFSPLTLHACPSNLTTQTVIYMAAALQSGKQTVQRIEKSGDSDTLIGSLLLVGFLASNKIIDINFESIKLEAEMSVNVMGTLKEKCISPMELLETARQIRGSKIGPHIQGRMSRVMTESALATAILGEEANVPITWMRDFFKAIEKEMMLPVMLKYGVVSGREELERLFESYEGAANKLLGI